MQEKIGVHGLSTEEVAGLMTSLKSGFSKLKSGNFVGANPILNITSRTDDFEAIEILTEAIRKRFNHVVVVGSGGSGLSGAALLAFAPCPAPSFDFLDNIDPDMLEDILAKIEIEHTCFIVISKSGTTLETLSQTYAIISRIKKKIGRTALPAQMIIITEPEEYEGKNPLRQLAREYDVRVLDHETDIGGRFAILTNVGLLPAAIAGIDIYALRRGARSVITQLENATSPEEFAPAIGAAVQYGFYQRSRNISVLLPYSQRLSGLAAWYRQCWAESLGKEGKGTTPACAMGSTDQHSQLQLYLSGPKDKLFHMITLRREGTGDEIEVLGNRPELAYMNGKTLGDVMAAQQKATFETLVGNRCPTRLIELDALTAEHFGALIMHFTLEIMFMSFLFEINPFDQPAVEESKILARQYLSSGERK
jgi:glucose-6-phosphate isomerase